MLFLKYFVVDAVEHEGRTDALDHLPGVMSFGAVGGFLIRGLVRNAFKIAASFWITMALFLLSRAYIMVRLRPRHRRMMKSRKSVGDWPEKSL